MEVSSMKKKTSIFKTIFIVLILAAHILKLVQKILMYLKGKAFKERERKSVCVRKNPSSAVSLSKCLQLLSVDQAKARSKECQSGPVHVQQGLEHWSHLPLLSQAYWQEARLDVQKLWLNCAPMCNASMVNSGWICYAIMPFPKLPLSCSLLYSLTCIKCLSKQKRKAGFRLRNNPQISVA